MIVMPACSSGWWWHSLARETGRLGHLYSPRDQRGPWPWFPYALDNGAYSCWNERDNSFDLAKWTANEQGWHELIFWAQAAPMRPLWAIVPDRPGNGPETFKRWKEYSGYVMDAGIRPALAVQDGMTVKQVRALRPSPVVICVGGTTAWKWETVAEWAGAFPRVHLLRCNSPKELDGLEKLGVESTDGTGWKRGDRTQTAGLELWCRTRATPTTELLWPHACRKRCAKQQTFA